MAGAQSPFDAGLEAYRQSDFARAEALLVPALDKANSGPKYVEAVAALGLIYHLQGNAQKAIPLLEKASGFAPRNVELAYALGISCLAQNRLPGARAAFARMFRVSPDSPQARLLTARFMMRERMEEQAHQELRPLAALEPALPEVHFLLGELAIYRSDFDEGIRELQKEIEVNPAFSMAFYPAWLRLHAQGDVGRGGPCATESDLAQPGFQQPVFFAW